MCAGMAGDTKGDDGSESAVSIDGKVFFEAEGVVANLGVTAGREGARTVGLAGT